MVSTASILKAFIPIKRSRSILPVSGPIYENGDIAYEEINSEIPDPSRCSRSFRHSFSYDGMNLDTISELEMEGMEVKKLPYLVENRG